MANRVMADLAVKISANTAEFQKSLKNSENSLRSLEKTANGVRNALGALGLGLSVGVLAKNIFDLGVRQEQTNVAFATFLGSADKATRLLAELNKFSTLTPFSPEQVNSAARTLLSFGLETEKIIPTLKFLGDISAGTGKDLTELSVIFGQIRSTGRLLGQDLLQLINAGFNPLQQISKDTGKSVGDLKKEMEKGAISFQQVEQAFINATSAGGLFFNLTEKQSQTVGGRISTLEGNFQELGKTIFGLTTGPLPALIDKLIEATVAFDLFLNPEKGKQQRGLEVFKKYEEAAKKIFEETKNADTARDAALDLFNKDLAETSKKLEEAEKVLEKYNQRLNQAAATSKSGFLPKGLIENQSKAQEEYNRLLELYNNIVNEGGKAIAEFYTGIKEGEKVIESNITTLESLEKKKKELLETYRKTDVSDKLEQANILNKIKAVDKEIEAVERLRSSILSLKEVEAIDTSIKTTISGGLSGPGLLPFQEELATYLNEIQEVSEDSASAVAASQAKTRAELEATASTVLAYSQIFATGLSDAISGQVSFAAALARTTDGIVQEYGRQAIAAMIAAAVKDPTIPFPIAKIAATVAAVGALSGILRKTTGYRGNVAGGSFAGGGAGFRSSFPSSSSFATVGQNARPLAEFQIRGQDLYVVLSNYEKNNRSTRNG